MSIAAAEGSAPRTVALMVTRRCNMTCAHCSVESGPRVRSQPSEAELEDVITQAADAGVAAILFTGGEPMLREDLVCRLMTVAKKCGLACAMTTNGFWGKTLPSARRTLTRLRKAGLTFFTLSYDRYHAEFQGPTPGENIHRAAEELGITMNVNITRVADDADIAGLIRPFERSRHARLRMYDVQPVGRARNFPASSLRGETEGSCQAAGLPAITDDGRLTACNGPSYFQPGTSPLNVGSIRESSVATLLRKHRDDPILQTIRTFGPSRLRHELTQIPGFETFPWKSSYAGICELCLQINSDPEAAAALRVRLSDPQVAAERAARKLVMDGVRERGESGRDYSNGLGAARLWMSGARAGGLAHEMWGAEAGRVFGRADVDWRQIADYIAACGLSRVLLPVVSDPRIARWAPALFADRIKADALKLARRELLQRSALDVLDSELSELGTTGVLLKGAALLAQEQDSGEEQSFSGELPRRGPGDIDILVPDGAADTLRKRLIARGWTGDPNARRSGPHHLGPVFFQGLLVEIHTSIMPSFWKLPETEMLSHKKRGSRFKSLFTLDTEGMLLHTLMHCSAHLFGCGLKTAWDVTWLVERTPKLDDDRLRAWADRCAMPAGFYLPAKVMRATLDVPIPAKVLAGGPDAPRFAALERAIQRRLYFAMEGAYELNPITKNGFFLLLHNSWRGRALHMTSLVRQQERESRAEIARMQHTSAPPAARQRLRAQIRQSAEQWRSYRKLSTVAREEFAHRRSVEMFSE